MRCWRPHASSAIAARHPSLATFMWGSNKEGLFVKRPQLVLAAHIRYTGSGKLAEFWFGKSLTRDGRHEGEQHSAGTRRLRHRCRDRPSSEKGSTPTANCFS